MYNADWRTIDLPTREVLAITDPPYNIGFGYDVYSDALPPNEYMAMLAELRKFEHLVIIQYPEETARFIVPALGPAQHYSAWCYNSNMARRFRLVSYYGCQPDYSRVRQPYKNQNDRRIKARIAAGHTGSRLYEWWNDIQLVKNVSREKSAHPCPIPEALARRIITLCAQPGDVIVDPFAGGLTVLKAANDLGYASAGCELSEFYIRDGLQRFGLGL